MDLEKYKITGYEDSVSSLPDYPSDAGYTAEQLKAIFDGRTDKEIKEKFNALIDELITRFGQVEVDIADEVEAHNGNSEAHGELREELITAISDKVTEQELATTVLRLESELAGKAGKGELASKADRADVDFHLNDFGNPHNVTAEQVGALTEEQTREIAYNTFVASEDYNGLLRDVRILQEQIGDISTALDELHTYAQALVNGGAE